MTSHPLPDQLQVLVGHPAPTSRTHRAAELLAEALTSLPCLPDSSRTTALGAFAGELHHPDDVGVLEALQGLVQARVIVVATPSYRGSVTGLLKSFLDLVPAGTLEGTVVVPLITAGSSVHGAQTDRHLRDVLRALDALVPTHSLVLPERALDDVEGEIDRWMTRWAPLLAGILRSDDQRTERQLVGTTR